VIYLGPDYHGQLEDRGLGGADRRRHRPVFKVFGKLPVNASLQAYYNVAHPEDLGPEWSMRFQLQFLFPK